MMGPLIPIPFIVPRSSDLVGRGPASMQWCSSHSRSGGLHPVQGCSSYSSSGVKYRTPAATFSSTRLWQHHPRRGGEGGGQTCLPGSLLFTQHPTIYTVCRGSQAFYANQPMVQLLGSLRCSRVDSFNPCSFRFILRL